MVGAKHEVYEDIGETPVEEGGRLETTHFRQDPPEDFTDPGQVEARAVGAKRRTTTIQTPLVENGPRWGKGVRSAWYFTVDDRAEIELVTVQTADELANLPENSLSAQEYINLISQESPVLAAQLAETLLDPQHHTAHHTQGADVGPRVKAIFQQAKLISASFKDKNIGRDIVIPPVQRRPRNPATLTGSDGVTW